MIKKCVFLLLITLLSGCFLGDKIIPYSKAGAYYRGEILCLTTPGSTDVQKFEGIIIDERGNSTGYSKFLIENESVSLSKGSCVPTYGYQFKTGHVYHIKILLTPDKNVDDKTRYVNSYTASFVLWETSNNVKHVELLQSNIYMAISNNPKLKHLE